MDLANLHTTKRISIYICTQSRRFCVTVLKHRMYEREHCRLQVRVGRGGGGGGLLPQEHFEKSVQYGDFWHVFMQFISCSESIIFNRQSHKILK